ncbi:maltokinase N-terminal cap-like domain-containing protein [Microbacterium sp. bgisy189]|uniref:maltokinase N-terminal cap-like domain-containing protein n=1 Tax=Microbacterium sp. bgisy189 TaxID=3413798 RepID=UPI003EB6EB39
MDRTLASLAGWMPRQRWYTSATRAPRLTMLGSWELPSDESGVTIRTHLLLDESVSPAVTYQVPVVLRPFAPDRGHVIDHPEPDVVVIDGPHDPAYTRALLRLITADGDARGDGASAAGHSSAPTPGMAAASRVLTGEQSNTSIIYTPADGGQPVICKLYRQLHPGLNPDIELQTALAAGGSPHTPTTFGWAEGTWTTRDGAWVTGSLAFAQEFVQDGEDAWRVALRAAHDGEDFTDSARALGAAVAGVHAALAAALPTSEPDDADREAAQRVWERRLGIAVSEVPALAEHREAIEHVYRTAGGTTWPRLQRIHGDLHLGQVLHSRNRGWIVLDYEGEPMRPMRERMRPDIALRDIAGMLRSFDYVAGSLESDEPASDAERTQAWAASARAAFIEGYDDVAGRASRGPLLDAFELDKAVYEAIYEARNRPTWLAIPLRAIERLLN